MPELSATRLTAYVLCPALDCREELEVTGILTPALEQPDPTVIALDSSLTLSDAAKQHLSAHADMGAI